MIENNMNIKPESFLIRIRKIFWIYHVISAVIGVLLLSPFAYNGIRQNDWKSVLGPLVLIILYVPFLIVTRAFLKAEKWAYYGVLFFYLLEVLSIPSLFELKLSLLHYSIVFPVAGFSLGVDIISLSIAVFLLLIKTTERS